VVGAAEPAVEETVGLVVMIVVTRVGVSVIAVVSHGLSLR
jgi:hypothetical protein